MMMGIAVSHSRTKPILSLAVLGVLAAMVMLPICSNNVSAWLPTENTWIANSDGLASNNGNWENGTLLQDQIIWFVGPHNGNCTWDVVDTQMPWGKNLALYQELRLVNYTGSIFVITPIYLVAYGFIMVPIDDHTTYPGALDWLSMSIGMSLLVVLLIGGTLFILFLWIIMKRRK